MLPVRAATQFCPCCSALGNYKGWQGAAGLDKTLDALIRVGRIPPLIAVLPDRKGGFFGGDPAWANSGCGTRAVRVETT